MDTIKHLSFIQSLLFFYEITVDSLKKSFLMNFKKNLIPGIFVLIHSDFKEL